MTSGKKAHHLTIRPDLNLDCCYMPQTSIIYCKFVNLCRGTRPLWMLDFLQNKAPTSFQQTELFLIIAIVPLLSRKSTRSSVGAIILDHWPGSGLDSVSYLTARPGSRVRSTHWDNRIIPSWGWTGSKSKGANICSSAIKVVARFRPANALELSQGGETIVSFESDDTLSLDMRMVRSTKLWDVIDV